MLDERTPVVAGQPLCALDLDDVIVNGQLLPSAAVLVDELNTYAEVSVSGGGLHLLAASTVAPGARRGKVNDLSVELITTGFLAITGVRWPETPPEIALRRAELAQLRRDLDPGSPPPCFRPAARPVADVLSALLGQRNGTKVRRLLIDGDTSGYPSPSEAVFAAARLIAWRTRDAGVIEVLLRESPLYTSRWERPVAAGRTWITHTVYRALSADRKGVHQ
ncbi:hypothetical protein BOO71_0005191 [Deinococcus marmoris]|uniref:Uncharacterized protein n=1 Tax=Deinococcus marmoris TaxID=249408 RepID=A0A1U7P0L5_9DEIO|nr:hypothetical protein BOO71_0009280 [Deinococcus marmoris]OLV18717.1 hypothetical protein BOO71_0005191 [Deinococcus marmoris]